MELRRRRERRVYRVELCKGKIGVFVTQRSWPAQKPQGEKGIFLEFLYSPSSFIAKTVIQTLSGFSNYSNSVFTTKQTKK